MIQTSAGKPKARSDTGTHPDPSLDSSARGWRARSGLVTGLSAALIVALIAMAVVFAVAKGTSDVAAQGTAGILEEASLSAAAAARNRTAQAQVIAEANAVGITSSDDVAQSLSRVEAATAELLRRTEQLTEELEDNEVAQRISADATALAIAIQGTAELIRAGNLADAEAAVRSDVEGSYQALAVLLADQRNQAMARIAVVRDDAGRLADAARFLVVLLVPFAVLLAYRTRSRHDQQRRELRHQLEKQEAISETKDEFIANLSHELRTPLTSIYGLSLEMLEGPAGQDPALSRELVTIIATESAELSRMVEDLLTAASADKGGLVVSMDQVDPVAEVAKVLDPLKATGIEIESDMEEALIVGDGLRLRQIIRNLVSNTHRHGGPNTRLVGRAEGDQYLIEIRDDGPGVPAHLEERLFTRFIHEGNMPLLTGSVGLGLSIAQLLATRTGATIAYRRENNETVFVVSYPLDLPLAA